MSETDEEKEYGFTDSYGMTIKYSNYADLDDYQYWWLRTPGEKNISAAAVDMFGEAYVGGGERYGVRNSSSSAFKSFSNR